MTPVPVRISLDVIKNPTIAVTCFYVGIVLAIVIELQNGLQEVIE